MGHDILPAFREFVRFKLRQEQIQPEWLVNRLTGAIAMRRQQFYYQRAHNRHMSNAPANQDLMIENKSGPTTLRSTQANTITTTQNKSSTPKPHSPAALNPAKTILTTKTYSTIATDFKPESPQEKHEDLAKPTKTEIGGDCVFPGPPKGSTEKAFECHQCFRILPGITRRQDLWR